MISFTAHDGCSQIGNAFDNYVASFAPGEFQTWDGLASTAKSFDPADMPCGPEGIDLKGKPYQPLFVPPPGLFDRMGGSGYEGCIFSGWTDPPTTLQSRTAVNRPPKAGFPQHRRAPATAHEAPIGPARTVEST